MGPEVDGDPPLPLFTRRRRQQIEKLEHGDPSSVLGTPASFRGGERYTATRPHPTFGGLGPVRYAKMKPFDTSLGGSKAEFPQTTGGLIARFADPDAPDRRGDLEELCQRYWKPVYRYLRMVRAKSNDDAKDLTQAFFVWLLEGEPLKSYQAERGSFRKFLKVLLTRFVRDQDEMRRAIKRGGGVKTVMLDEKPEWFEEHVADPRTSEPWEEFDREWAVSLTRHAIDRVRTRRRADGREITVRVFEAYDLLAPEERPSYAQLAATFGVKETDIQNYLTAVRHEVYAEVRAELAHLTREDVDLRDEWNALFKA